MVEAVRVVIDRPGGHQRLKLHRVNVPEPAPDEVGISVQAIGVNYADCIVRMGLYESAKKFVGWPITPGFEVAGTVSSVGSAVTDVKVGEGVFAVTRFGGYASAINVPREQVFRIPVGWTAAQAAAFPSVFLTAAYALGELAHPRKGERVLVHSAAGGVGSALVQLAKIAECFVVGVVGMTSKVEAVKELGADVVIDKSTQDLWPQAERHAPDGYDVVLDANGVSTLKHSYNHLAPGGKLIVYGFHSMLPRKGGTPNWPKLAMDWLRTPKFDPLAMTGENRSVLAFNLSYLFNRTDLLQEAMGKLNQEIARGLLKAPRVTSFPLDKVADAHAAIESGTTIGKLVLVP